MNMNGTRVNFEKWTRGTLKRSQNGRKIPVVAIIYQRFPCVRKLILQENFLRYFQKYAFFV